MLGWCALTFRTTMSSFRVSGHSGSGGCDGGLLVEEFVDEAVFVGDAALSVAGDVVLDDFSSWK